MINCNTHEHGRVYSNEHINVDIDNRETYFTIYTNEGERPVATIFRPRMYSRNAKWEVFATDGTLIGKAFGARSAFCYAVVWHRKMQPKPVAEVAATTSVGGNGLTGRIA